MLMAPIAPVLYWAAFAIHLGFKNSVGPPVTGLAPPQSRRTLISLVSVKQTFQPPLLSYLKGLEKIVAELSAAFFLDLNLNSHQNRHKML